MVLALIHIRVPRVGYFVSTSSKKASARGSFDWPSQNIASLRTSLFRFLRATAISFGTPSSLGSWLKAKTAFFFFTSVSGSFSMASAMAVAAFCPAFCDSPIFDERLEFLLQSEATTRVWIFAFTIRASCANAGHSVASTNQQNVIRIEFATHQAAPALLRTCWRRLAGSVEFSAGWMPPAL